MWTQTSHTLEECCKYSHYLFLAILCSLSPTIPRPCFHFPMKQISRNNNKNITQKQFCFWPMPVVTGNAKLSFEHILPRNLKVHTVQPSGIQNQSAKIQIKYFKCHSIQNDRSTHNVYELLASLRDTIQRFYFYREIIILHPCHQDKNDYMWLENMPTTVMILGTLNVNHHIFQANVLHKQQGDWCFLIPKCMEKIGIKKRTIRKKIPDVHIYVFYKCLQIFGRKLSSTTNICFHCS